MWVWRIRHWCVSIASTPQTRSARDCNSAQSRATANRLDRVRALRYPTLAPTNALPITCPVWPRSSEREQHGGAGIQGQFLEFCACVCVSQRRLQFVNTTSAEKKNLALILKKLTLAMNNAVLQILPPSPPMVPGTIPTEDNEPLVWLLVVVAVAAPAIGLLLFASKWLFARAQMPPVLRQTPRFYNRDSTVSQPQSSSRRGGATPSVKQKEVAAKEGAAKDVVSASAAQSPRASRGYAGQTRREYFSSF
jgi:hypothetical protein